MNNKCKHCGASLYPHPSSRVVAWTCGSDELDGALFRQSDKCRIRELEQQVKTLSDDATLQGVTCNDCGLCCQTCGPRPPVCSLEEVPHRLQVEVVASGGTDQEAPCMWYDARSHRCVHYEDRPLVCREFLVGGLHCIGFRWRAAQQQVEALTALLECDKQSREERRDYADQQRAENAALQAEVVSLKQKLNRYSREDECTDWRLAQRAYGFAVAQYKEFSPEHSVSGRIGSIVNVYSSTLADLRSRLLSEIAEGGKLLNEIVKLEADRDEWKREAESNGQHELRMVEERDAIKLAVRFEETTGESEPITLPEWCRRLTAENATLRAEVERLRTDFREVSNQLADLEDCRERLRDLGRWCGCDHVESSDERSTQAQHIHEAFEKLTAENAVLRAVLRKAHSFLEFWGGCPTFLRKIAAACRKYGIELG